MYKTAVLTVIDAVFTRPGLTSKPLTSHRSLFTDKEEKWEIK